MCRPKSRLGVDHIGYRPQIGHTRNVHIGRRKVYDQHIVTAQLLLYKSCSSSRGQGKRSEDEDAVRDE